MDPDARVRERPVEKLILMSVLIATFAIPFVYSARPLVPRQGIRLVQKRFVVFSVSYVIAIIYVLPRL